MRTEGRPERSRAGERLEARRHWHWLVLQHLRGLGARDAWSAPYPSAANTCTRKEVTPLPGVEIERHVLFLSATAIVVSRHACSSNDDILQLV